MYEFLRNTKIEMRLTVGQDWENQFFYCRAPFLSKLCDTDFRHRASEANFTRNILMFNSSSDFVNVRMTFGVCRDFECDISEIKGLEQFQKYPSSQNQEPISIAPVEYFNRNMALNSIPKRWFEIIEGDSKVSSELAKERDRQAQPEQGKEMNKQKDALNRSFESESKPKLPQTIVVPKIKMQRASSATKPLQIQTNDVQTPSEQTKGQPISQYLVLSELFPESHLRQLETKARPLSGVSKSTNNIFDPGKLPEDLSNAGFGIMTKKKEEERQKEIQDFEEADYDFRLNQDAFDMGKIQALEQRNIQMARGLLQQDNNEQQESALIDQSTAREQKSNIKKEKREPKVGARKPPKPNQKSNISPAKKKQPTQLKQSRLTARSASEGQITGRQSTHELPPQPELKKVRSPKKKGVYDVMTGKIRSDVLLMENERRARSQPHGKRDVDVTSSVGYRLQRQQIKDLLVKRAKREKQLVENEKTLYKLKKEQIETEIMKNLRQQRLMTNI